MRERENAAFIRPAGMSLSGNKKRSNPKRVFAQPADIMV
jgi:hypothetical protein